MGKLERIEFEQFFGTITSLKENPKVFSELPNIKFMYLIQNYYTQGAAMFTEAGLNHWKSYVTNTIVRQGYFRNILKYTVPSLRTFAEQAGKREVVLLKWFNGTFVLEDEKLPKITERSVDNRNLLDWERNENIQYWAMNQLGNSIFEDNKADFLISQVQHGCKVRVSEKVASAWKHYTKQWHYDSLGQIVEYPLLKDFIKNLPKHYKSEVKIIV